MTDHEGEFARIERLARLFERDARDGSGVTLGIGDDAAILRPPADRELVWTVDAQVEGQHFRREWMSLEDIGWRSFVAAASDLFAMGAVPWCALSALALPGELADAALDALTRGQAEAAREVGCPVVGGNLSRAGELSVTTTLMGSAVRAVRRAGARPGDGVWLLGEIGLAAVGLHASTKQRHGPELDAGLAAFRRPRIRAAGGRVVAEHAHAAIDVSDGLAQDAAHLATASQVSLVLDEGALLEHAGEALHRAASSLGEDVKTLVLAGGEDYALLATASAAMPGFTRIGEVVTGDGVWLRDARGALTPLASHATSGFDHFARQER